MDPQPLKAAVLADGDVQLLLPALEAALRERGFSPELYAAPPDAFETELLSPDSGLYRFAPGYVLLHPSTPRLRERWHAGGRPADFDESEHARVAGWWARLGERLPARIIQSTFAAPVERELGGYSLLAEGSLSSVVSRLNARLVESARARPGVLLNDVAHLAALAGLKSWQDERMWAHARLSCGPAHFPALARNLAGVIAAAEGRAPKCLVLDLDNTLWGGLVGDDGPEGIVVGGDGLGAAYAGFQRFLLAARARGLLLAVCSNNDEAVAREAFRRRPEMPLRESDFAAFFANRRPKPENIAALAAELSLGVEHLALIDDSPFERGLARAALPALAVPDLPEDPADFAAALCEQGLFETASLTAEDARRAEGRASERARAVHKAAFTDTASYLASLKMKPTVSPLTKENLARVCQLSMRSNQFNLTTRRYTESECRALVGDPARPFLCVSLSDAFGDYGLVAVVAASVKGRTLEVDAWFMSCRVLQRGLERFCLDALVALARERACAEIEGRYLPTARNGLVAGHYEALGFSRAGDAWRLEVSR